MKESITLIATCFPCLFKLSTPHCMAISENASARGLLLQTNRSSTFLFAQKRFPQCLLLLERRWVEWIQSLLHFFNSPPALPSTLTQQRNLRPYKQQQCCQSKIEYKYPPFHSWSFPSSYFLLSYLSFFFTQWLLNIIKTLKANIHPLLLPPSHLRLPLPTLVLSAWALSPWPLWSSLSTTLQLACPPVLQTTLLSA